VGYASGALGEAGTEAIQDGVDLATKKKNWGSFVTKDALLNSLNQMNKHGWFLCRYAQTTGLRMQFIGSAGRYGVRVAAGVHKEYFIDEETGDMVGRLSETQSPFWSKQYTYVKPSLNGGYLNWQRREISRLELGTGLPNFISNLIGSATFAPLARFFGAEDQKDTSKLLLEVPEVMVQAADNLGDVRYRMEKRLDPAAAIFGPMAGFFPLAPLVNSKQIQPLTATGSIASRVAGELPLAIKRED
jgi:hypothetical protein